MWSIPDSRRSITEYSHCTSCRCFPSSLGTSFSSSLLSSYSSSSPPSSYGSPSSSNPQFFERQPFRQSRLFKASCVMTTSDNVEGMKNEFDTTSRISANQLNSKNVLPPTDKLKNLVPHSVRRPRLGGNVNNNSSNERLFSLWPRTSSFFLVIIRLSVVLSLLTSISATSILHQHQHSSGALSSVSLFSQYESESLSPRTVHTKYGSLRGVLVHFKSDSGRFAGKVTSTSQMKASLTGHGSKTVEVFLGISYATPPVGSLRFMPPVTPTHWRGVKAANRFSPVCPQRLPESLKHHRSESIGMNSGNINNNGSRGSHLQSSSTNSRSGVIGSNGVKPNFNFTPNSYGSLSSSTTSMTHSSSSSSTSSSQMSLEVKTGHLKRMASIAKNQSEDCLYLNIYAPYTYTPSSSPSSPPSSSFTSSSSSSSPSSESSRKTILYPVVVFIHGDSFDWSSANPFDGSLLPGFGEAVLVTLNYRLGLFGFLPASVDGSGPRGNYGLMDQVAALHWIQENIVEFGGDPMNVTLVGHGFGAACVNLLMVSPLASSALFTRTVLLSGSALCPWSGTCPWATNRDADTNARLLGKSLNCPTYDNLLMVECLRSKTVDELLSVDMKVPEHSSAFGPIIDGIVIPSDVRSVISPISETTTTPVTLEGVTGPGVQISFRFPNSPNASLNESKGASLSSQKSTGKMGTTNKDIPSDASSNARMTPTSANFPTNSHHNNKSTLATPMIMEQGTYSTALLVTIAVGCALLVLNMLIFAGVYYQLDKAKNGRKDRRRSQQTQDSSQNDSPAERRDTNDRMDCPSPYKTRTVTFDGVNSSVHLDCGYNATGSHVDFTAPGHETCTHNNGSPHVDWYHPQTVVHWAN